MVSCPFTSTYSIPVGKRSGLLRIAAFSQGFPHYTHLLGLHAALHAIDRDSAEVDARDVDYAVTVAIKESQQSVVAAYRKAVTSHHPDNLYRQTLLACAMTPGDDLGYFSAGAVREPMSQVMRSDRAIPSYLKQVQALTREDRGSVLQTTGATRVKRFRFANPLLRPYVVFRGIEEGAIRESGAFVHSAPEVARQLSLFNLESRGAASD